MRVEEIEITMVNWQKHQDVSPDKRSGRPNRELYWLKLRNTVYRSASLWELDDSEKWCFTTLLCLCSQKSTADLKFSIEWWEYETRISKKILLSCIQKLSKNGTIINRSLPDGIPLGIPREEKIREDKIRYIRPSGGTDHELIFDIWNKQSPPLIAIKARSSKRVNAAKIRWAENPDAEYWTFIIQKIVASPFLMGDSRSNWRADIDWLLKPMSHVRICEGHYDKHQQKEFQGLSKEQHEALWKKTSHQTE